ncbi:MAG: hypothetical protein FWE14_03595 [Lachnospiraceae bacterium]|nr:hypothetical protein [Lachnospiraceae bacterium]
MKSRVDEIINDLKEKLLPYKKLKDNLKDWCAPLDETPEEIKRSQIQYEELLKAIEPTLELLERVEKIIQERPSTSDYIDKVIEERHKVLDEYGWFYAFGISDQLSNEIYKNHNILGQGGVDTMVINFFKDNNYAELKKIITKYKNSLYFESRAHIFDEAFINHKEERFYSSVTLLSVHTEGIIKDYIRKKVTARYRLDRCINDLDTLLVNKAAYFPNVERKILFEFLVDVFDSDFSPTDPDFQRDLKEPSHNLSRHKIAHGNVFKGLSEVDSLKCFLYLNAIRILLFELSQDSNE